MIYNISMQLSPAQRAYNTITNTIIENNKSDGGITPVMDAV